MKTQKHFFIAATILLCCSSISIAQPHLGGGYYNEWHTSTYKDKDVYEKYRNLDLNGFFLGFSYNFQFQKGKGIGIAPGAYFTFAAGHNVVNLEGYFHTVDRGSLYHHLALQVPVHITYSHDAGPGCIFAYAGPSLNIGIDYKYRDKDYEEGEKYVYDFYEMEDCRRLDCKLGFGLGYRWQHLSADVGLDFGLVNRLKDYSEGWLGECNRGHIHSFHVGVAYVF